MPQVLSALTALAAAAPRTAAIRDGARTLTRADLAAIFDAIGDRTPELRALGRGNVCIGMVGHPSAAALAAVGGLMMSGWAVGILDPDWRVDELTGALAQLDADLVVGGGDLAGWDLVATLAGLPVRRRARPPLGSSAPVPPDVFYVGFTSGSSGRPKAFMRTHRSWVASFAGLDRVAGELRGEVIVPGPLAGSHFLFGALHGLNGGATVRLVPPGGAMAAVAERLGEGGEEVAGLYVVPSMLNDLARMVAGRPVRCTGTIFCAGARLDSAVRDAVAHALPDARVVEYYGASELSFVAIRVDGDGTPEGSVGRAFPAVELATFDDAGRPSATGVEGQIAVRSALVFSGYRGVEPATGARDLGDGWLTVGDRGTLDADGYLRVSGRGSALIITGGANVQPEEVEGVLTDIAGIADCAVVGMDDSRWGQVPVAVITLSVEDAPSRAEVRREVVRRLSGHKRPRHYLIAPRLPRLAGGKVDRDAVCALVLAGELRELT